MPSLAASAAFLPLAAMFDRHCRLQPDRTAVEGASTRLSYAGLSERADRLATLLEARGARAGDRVCLLHENDPVFAVLSVAAMRLRLVVATLNPRFAPAELQHAIALVRPRVTLVSARHAAALQDARVDAGVVLATGPAFERALDDAPPRRGPAADGDPEDILYVVYTSGTTGRPKGAMLSHRAMLARLMVYVLDYGVDGGDTFPAWSPLCHMASIELGLGMLLLGGKVAMVDGLDLPRLCRYLEEDSVANLTFFPGIADAVLAELRRRPPRVRRLKKFGSLADLYTPDQVAGLSGVLGVPYTNTFGSTETGMAPASAGRIPSGERPVDLAKTPSSLCELRLVDADGRDVPDGVPGEMLVRGPTLFSGYWDAPEASAEALAGGWYHTGDVFVRDALGRYAFVDRRKYLIKSGGENVYPAEIERVVLAHPGVREAVVVRRRDDAWGEVPVLYVAVEPRGGPDAAALLALCRAELAGFKRPRAIRFVEPGSLPRNATGKVVRAEVERLEAGVPLSPPDGAGT